MLAFVTGFGLVFAVLCGFALSGEARGGPLGFPPEMPGDWAPLVVLLFVLPLATAWGRLDVLHRLRGRRWFDYRIRRRARLLALGVVSGLVAAAECTILLAWGERFVPAWGIIPACTVLAVAGAFVLIPGVRTGRCIHCGYDVRDGGLNGRCSECGALDPV